MLTRTHLSTNFRNVALAMAARAHMHRLGVGETLQIGTWLPRLADKYARERAGGTLDFGAQYALEKFTRIDLPRIVGSITVHGHGPIRYCREDIDGVKCTCV